MHLTGGLLRGGVDAWKMSPLQQLPSRLVRCLQVSIGRPLSFGIPECNKCPDIVNTGAKSRTSASNQSTSDAFPAWSVGMVHRQHVTPAPEGSSFGITACMATKGVRERTREKSGSFEASALHPWGTVKVHFWDGRLAGNARWSIRRKSTAVNVSIGRSSFS